jgi:peroxiredoxin
MPSIGVGQRAPSFHLPSGQGPVVSLHDYRGRRRVIVWFTKGMGCPFCRSQMLQLARGHDRLKALDAEVLQITPTRPELAVSYVRSFAVPFTYLCDPDYRVYGQWGLDRREHSMAWYARAAYGATKLVPPPDALAGPPPSLQALRTNLLDTDAGFFVIDRDGIVRYAMSGPYAGPGGVRGIPTIDEIAHELQRAA